VGHLSFGGGWEDREMRVRDAVAVDSRDMADGRAPLNQESLVCAVSAQSQSGCTVRRDHVRVRTVRV
jgi:hypothetical protein